MPTSRDISHTSFSNKLDEHGFEESVLEGVYWLVGACDHVLVDTNKLERRREKLKLLLDAQRKAENRQNELQRLAKMDETMPRLVALCTDLLDWCSQNDQSGTASEIVDRAHVALEAAVRSLR